MIRMSHIDLMTAYATCKTHFGLKHQQRTDLATSPLYLDIMIAVHEDRFQDAERLLWDANILAEPQILLPADTSDQDAAAMKKTTSYFHLDTHQVYALIHTPSVREILGYVHEGRMSRARQALVTAGVIGAED